jgi:hypothetical protein
MSRGGPQMKSRLKSDEFQRSYIPGTQLSGLRDQPLSEGC